MSSHYLLKENDMYNKIANKSISQNSIDDQDIEWILTADEVEILPLLNAAYQVRTAYFGNNVKIHILNNVQSGGCSEDCKYCAQSKASDSQIEIYGMKSDAEILKEAEQAYEAGAYRHCMVFSGRELGDKRIDKICGVVKEIKKQFPMEICVSAGFLNTDDAQKLVDAGVNRYNHNLNTSSSHYANICSTHSYQKRVDTIQTAKSNGLDICSGVIIGMGESVADIVKMINELRAVEANSVPVNFFIPVDGHRLSKWNQLTPTFCLKVLCAFRLALPKTGIRASAGREYHLRSMQALCLFAVNSIFAKGYLTTGGDDIQKTKQMIEDSGFVVEEIAS